MEFFEQSYQQILSYFPNFLHPIISIGLAVLIGYSIFRVLQRNFIYLIVLVVLLPASIPILKRVAEVLMDVIKFLIPG